MSFNFRLWVRWTLTFIGFPVAGLAAKTLSGPVDGSASAALGGMIAGACLGAVQALAIRTSVSERLSWMAATSVGMAVGLALGASLVNFETNATSLVVMGAVTGSTIGVAQAFVFPEGGYRRLTWALATPALWALGWLVTANVISDPEARYSNFGATGAIVCATLGGVVLALGSCSDSSR